MGGVTAAVRITELADRKLSSTVIENIAETLTIPVGQPFLQELVQVNTFHNFAWLYESVDSVKIRWSVRSWLFVGPPENRIACGKGRGYLLTFEV